MMVEPIAAQNNTDGLTCVRDRSLALITLSRPEKRNALTIAARARLAASLPTFARDPLVYAAAIHSTVEGVFCAGGDVVEMAALADRDIEAAEAALGDELSLVWCVECFTKPIVSLIDGIAMGGGNGISRYGTHRVAGERYRFSMPETALGFFPNNGLSHAFSRMPKDIGMYLAMTGESIGPADAMHLGLVTHCIPSTEFGAIMAALSDADPVDPVLDDRHRDPGPAPLAARADVINRCFNASTVTEIIARLEHEKGAHATWAAEARARLLSRSPTALVVAHRMVREASAMELIEVLELEHAVMCRMMELPDVHAAVRAMIEKRKETPQWRPGRAEDVSMAAIDAIFSPPESQHVRLMTRAKMQETMT